MMLLPQSLTSWKQVSADAGDAGRWSKHDTKHHEHQLRLVSTKPDKTASITSISRNLFPRCQGPRQGQGHQAL